MVFLNHNGRALMKMQIDSFQCHVNFHDLLTERNSYKEMLPAKKVSHPVISLITGNTFVEFELRQKHHQLTKNSLTGIHNRSELGKSEIMNSNRKILNAI
jgi:hypothetical protein